MQALIFGSALALWAQTGLLTPLEQKTPLKYLMGGKQGRGATLGPVPARSAVKMMRRCGLSRFWVLSGPGTHD
jgi:hypothetical protein